MADDGDYLKTKERGKENIDRDPLVQEILDKGEFVIHTSTIVARGVDMVESHYKTYSSKGIGADEALSQVREAKNMPELDAATCEKYRILDEVGLYTMPDGRTVQMVYKITGAAASFNLDADLRPGNQFYYELRMPKETAEVLVERMKAEPGIVRAVVRETVLDKEKGVTNGIQEVLGKQEAGYYHFADREWLADEALAEALAHNKTFDRREYIAMHRFYGGGTPDYRDPSWQASKICVVNTDLSKLINGSETSLNTEETYKRSKMGRTNLTIP